MPSHTQLVGRLTVAGLHSAGEGWNVLGYELAGRRQPMIVTGTGGPVHTPGTATFDLTVVLPVDALAPDVWGSVALGRSYPEAVLELVDPFTNSPLGEVLLSDVRIQAVEEEVEPAAALLQRLELAFSEVHMVVQSGAPKADSSVGSMTMPVLTNFLPLTGTRFRAEHQEGPLGGGTGAVTVQPFVLETVHSRQLQALWHLFVAGITVSSAEINLEGTGGTAEQWVLGDLVIQALTLRATGAADHSPTVEVALDPRRVTRTVSQQSVCYDRFTFAAC